MDDHYKLGLTGSQWLQFGYLALLGMGMVSGAVVWIDGRHADEASMIARVAEKQARDEQMIIDLKDAVIDIRNDNQSLASAQKQMLDSLRDAIDRLQTIGVRPPR